MYGGDANLGSCWGLATDKAFAWLRPASHFDRIVDVGCGTGEYLVRVAEMVGPSTQIVGVEPAAAMREGAVGLCRDRPNVRVVDGRFEAMPLEAASVDYLFSLMAFHWVPDPQPALSELARVLGDEGQMDIVFAGRRTGHEFAKVLTPIFLKFMGPRQLLQAAKLRQQLDLDATRELFAASFPDSRLEIEEDLQAYYDDLDGHWGWWVARAQGQLDAVPPDRREACNAAVRAAIEGLEQSEGIPYTVHAVHVRLVAGN